MKINILAFCVLLSFAACNNISQKETSTEENTSADGAPVMKFETDVYEFDKIKEGQSVSYDFKFTNTGKTPLIVKDAAVTCGCTVPEIPKEPIAPGKTGVVKVVFNSAGKVGLQDKVVTITANTIPAQTLIHLIGEVVK
ncbi:DUF1573 domain-containing protein [Pedobacter alpinus]|uniref:DUF1573 domain-containing protein n=1 Tax=Pedobacter alpinus TaxID=1590643 RepID=A0ABW5TUC9_9SPHI